MTTISNWENIKNLQDTWISETGKAENQNGEYEPHLGNQGSQENLVEAMADSYTDDPEMESLVSVLWTQVSRSQKDSGNGTHSCFNFKSQAEFIGAPDVYLSMREKQELQKIVRKRLHGATTHQKWTDRAEIYL